MTRHTILRVYVHISLTYPKKWASVKREFEVMPLKTELAPAMFRSCAGYYSNTETPVNKEKNTHSPAIDMPRGKTMVNTNTNNVRWMIYVSCSLNHNLYVQMTSVHLYRFWHMSTLCNYHPFQDMERSSTLQVPFNRKLPPHQGQHVPDTYHRAVIFLGLHFHINRMIPFILLCLDPFTQ